MITVKILETNGTIPVNVGGAEQDMPVANLEMSFLISKIEQLDSLYDPTQSDSPPHEESKEFIRAILDAWRARND